MTKPDTVLTVGQVERLRSWLLGMNPEASKLTSALCDLALKGIEAEAIVQKHLARLPNFDPYSDRDLPDKIEQGYGNACLNIAKEMGMTPARKEIPNPPSRVESLENGGLRFTNASTPQKPEPSEQEDFLGRCQKCLDNAYLSHGCEYEQCEDCLVGRAKYPLAEPQPSRSCPSGKLDP